MPKPIDDSIEPEVVQQEKEKLVAKPEKVVESPKPQESEKLSLSPEELQAKINEALEAERAKRTQEEETRKAEEEGNYKLLLEKADARAVAAERKLWVQQALNKFNLEESFSDMLLGDTKETIMAAAKKLHASIEVAVTKKLETEGAIMPDPGKLSLRAVNRNVDDEIRKTIKQSFNIGTVLH